MNEPIIDLDALASQDREQPLPDGPKPVHLKADGPKPGKSAEATDSLEASAKDLKTTSDKIQRHEERHAAAIRDFIPDSHPRYIYKPGPDGKHYVIAGEVRANLTPLKGRPDVTEAKAEAVFRSAISDHERSADDNEAARLALLAAQEARREKSQRMLTQGRVEPSPILHRFREQRANGDVVMHSPGWAMAAAAAFRGAANVATTASRNYARRSIARARTAAGQGNASLSNKYLARAAAARNIGPKAHAVADKAIALTAAFQNLTTIVNAAAKNIGQLGDRIQYYSPDVNIQRSINQVNRFQQDVRQARELGPGVAEFEKQFGRIDIAGRQIGGDAIGAALPALNELVQLVAGMSEIGGHLGGLLLDWIVNPISQVIGSALAPFGAILDLIARGLAEVRRLLGKDLNKMDQDPNLNLVWAMHLPDENGLPPQHPQFQLPLVGF